MFNAAYLRFVLKRGWYRRALLLPVVMGVLGMVALLCSVPLLSFAASEGALQNVLRASSGAAVTTNLEISALANVATITRAGDVEPPVSTGLLPLEEQFFSKAITANAQAALGSDLVPALPLRKGELDNLSLYAPDNLNTPLNNANLWFQSSMNSAHLRLTQGRFPSSSVKMTRTDQGNVYDVEVMLSPAWAEQLQVKLNDVLVLEDANQPLPNIVHLHLVGLFQPKALSGPAWFGETDAFTEPLTSANEPLPPTPIWLDEPVFETMSVALVTARSATFTWSYYLDHTTITPMNAASVAANMRTFKDTFQSPEVGRSGKQTQVVTLTPQIVSALDTRLQSFLQQLFFAKTTALVAVLPGLALLLVYLGMASTALADHYREELALMKSRGANLWQMLSLALIEAAFLCGAALIIAPLLAGFVMSFLAGVGVFGSVPVSFSASLTIPSPEAYLYAGVAAVLCLLALLLPAIGATRASLLDVKRQYSRSRQRALVWRLFPGLLLFALGVLGYLQMQQQNAFFVQNIHGQEVSIDWVTALAPCLVLVGIAGLTLLLIPSVLALLDRLGQRLPLIQATLALRQMARRPVPYSRLVLLLTLTVALSVYVTLFQDALSSSYAGRAAYQAGSDLRLIEGPADFNDIDRQAAPLQDHLTLLPGVQAGMNLLRAGGVVPLRGVPIRPAVTVLGVDSAVFPRLAYWRPDFAEQSLPDLMAHLTQPVSQQAALPALVDDQMLSDLHLHIGSQVIVQLGFETDVDFVITGTFHYFPTLDTTSAAVVCDLTQLLTLLHEIVSPQIAPNEVWLKLAPNAPQYTAAQVEQRLLNNPQGQQVIVTVQHAYDRAALDAGLRNQPLEAAFSKALLFDFIIAALVISTGLALLLYLITQQRAFEFGVLRAMGLSLRQLLGALSWEQGVLTGAALLMGIPLGGIVVGLALPALSRDEMGQPLLPPLSLSLQLPSFVGQGLFLLACLAGALVVTIIIFRRLRVQEVLRLGEE